MSKMIEATFDGEVIRADEPLDLEPNSRVRITVERVNPKKAAQSFLDTALALNLEGPPDWSTRLDDYLYGQRNGE